MELETFKLLYSKGYGPPVFATFDNGIAYGFVEGEVLDTDTICDDHISKLISILSLNGLYLTSRSVVYLLSVYIIL